MKISSILFIVSLVCFAACSAQTTHSSIQPSADQVDAAGDTVQKLGKHLWYIFQDSKGNYWFASNGEGVYRYDGKYILRYTKKEGLSSDSIRQIQEDRFGNIYFSTLQGINKFDGSRITSLHAIPSDDWKLEDDDMWFYMLGKTNEVGPYRYDGKHLYRLTLPKHYLHDEFMQRGINPFFSPYEVYSIYKDRQGAMWFGTSVFGACRFDGKSLKWMYETDITIAPNGGSFGIRSILEDSKGRFWICNTNQQFEFDFSQSEKSDRLIYKKTKGISGDPTFENGKTAFYTHMFEQPNGDLWFVSWVNGVYKFDGKTVQNFKVMDGNETASLVSLYQDHAGVFWAGSTDHGVFRFNGIAFERFNP